MRPRRRGGIGVHGVDEGLNDVRVVALGIQQSDVEEELGGGRLDGRLEADEDGGARPLLVRKEFDIVLVEDDGR